MHALARQLGHCAWMTNLGHTCLPAIWLATQRWLCGSGLWDLISLDAIPTCNSEKQTTYLLHMGGNPNANSTAIRRGCGGRCGGGCGGGEVSGGFGGGFGGGCGGGCGGWISDECGDWCDAWCDDGYYCCGC